jgi:hypothetical protein
MIYSPKGTMAMSIMDRADELITIGNTEKNSCNENEVLSQPFGLRSLSVFLFYYSIVSGN